MVLLIGHSLKGKTGIDVLKGVRERKLNCPVVMITGAPDVKTASEAVRLGAFEYITKPVLQDTLLRVTRTALQQKKLADENNKYRLNLEAIIKSVKDVIITVDMDLSVIEINKTAKKFCGLSRDSIGEKINYLVKDCNGRCVKALEETVKKRQSVEIYRIECRHKQRPQQIMTITTQPLINNEEIFAGAVLVARDETHVADLEKEMKERRQYHNIIGKSREIQNVYYLTLIFIQIINTPLYLYLRSKNTLKIMKYSHKPNLPPFQQPPY